MVDSHNTALDAYEAAYEVDYEPAVRPTGYVDLDAVQNEPILFNDAPISYNRQSSENTNEDDVWDDSALIEAWDAAVHEYQTYHANNKQDNTVNKSKRKLKRIPSQYQRKQTKTQIENTSTTNTAQSDSNTPSKTNPQYKINEMETDPLGQPSYYEYSTNEQYPPHYNPFTSASHPTFPQDPDTMNMVMAWYYAGYYTAIHQTKQQQQQQQQQPSE
ncbi:hypothetical protein BDF19DRAFT_448395 [Syncephalis fuscata]|nr:hypothetical protein BDF19DRAFT_448395 [Syncephalis fuscata]